MAAYYFGISHGDPSFKATVASSTTGKDLEIVANSSVFTDRTSVLLAIEKLKEFVTQSNFPPL